MNVDQYIFFLQLTKQLPEEYFHLAAALKKYQVTLLPVEPKEFLEVSKGKRSHLIGFTPSIAALRMLVKVKKIFLDWALVNKRFTFYNVSSFTGATVNPKLLSLENFHHIPLPIMADELAKEIATAYYNDKKVTKIWPGGRTPRLSSQVSEKS